MNKSKFSLDVDDMLEVQEMDQEIDREALKNFADGALKHKDTIEKVVKNWKNEDPDELPSYNFRLRLNKYQIALLKHVASIEKRSLSNLVKVILIDALSKKADKS